MSPDFANRLRQMGVVQPNPTYSPSSIASPVPDISSASLPNQTISAPQFPSARNNATLGVLDARRQLQERAEQEVANIGKSGYKGREFIEASAIREILMLRQQGHSPADIEARLRLRPGVVARLGPLGVVAPAL